MSAEPYNGRGSWYAADHAASLDAIRRVLTEPPRRPTIGGVLFPASTTTWAGVPDAGKSLAAGALAARVVMNGGPVLWIDYEMGERRVIERLVAFGLTENEIAANVYRVHHPLGLPDAAFFDLYAGVTLGVFDGVTGLLGAFGGNSNSADDVERVYATILRPLAETGTGVLSLDHVVKDKDNRGSWAFGSQRKISAPDHAYAFDSVRKFRPDHGGHARLRALRDRAGGIGVVDFFLEAEMAWRFECDATGEKRLTGWMQTVCIYLEAQDEPRE
jgi:hypothetical protein